MNFLREWRQTVWITIIGAMVVQPAMAEQSGWISAGLTYTRDLAAQTTLTQGITGSDALSRSGFETGAGFTWSSIDYDGGTSATLRGVFDKGFDANTDIVDVGLSATWMRALSTRWLFRGEASTALYRNDAFRSSGYDRVGVQTTLGYFADNAGGVDLSLGLFAENHDQDPETRYDNNRYQAEMIYYLPHKKNQPRWDISAMLQRNDASLDQLRYDSVLLRAGWSDWRIGSFAGSLAAQWRRDDYDGMGLTTSGGFMNRGPQGSPTGMMPGGSRQRFPANATSATREDTLIWLSMALSRAIDTHWNVSLNVNAGVYDSQPMDNQRWFSDLAVIFKRQFR